MRQIKFRAYDKVGEVMISSDELLTANSAYLKDSLTDTKNLKLMQFTGLTDKNGTEIYEGDIVKVYQDDEVLFNHHVEWSDGNGCCSIVVNHSDYDITTMAWAEDQFSYEYEIVGNIHQNPELLEQNDEYNQG